MKTSMKAFVLLGALTAMINGVFAQTYELPANMRKNIVANQLPNELRIPDNVRSKIMIKRIDLQATAINFSVETCKDKLHATVKIEGVVKNTGGLAFTSSPNQQVALLYENTGSRPRLVATKVFQNLSPGQEVRVSYSRPWYKASPAEGEFPPQYILIISYDPDIYSDSNDNNDDSNTANNRLEKSGSEINAMPFNCK
ncbi:MAG: hypothetical protein JST39_07980 [Bacteroidetes bacterium]|nr:hypothetical protein [Bacteroidota bacterium]